MKAYIVEKENLVGNIQRVRALAKDAVVWGVLKGNGYGIGLIPLAKLLSENGVTHFAVTELREAEHLREHFADAPILMLRSTSDPAEINKLLDMKVIMTLGSYETAVAINAIAGERAAIAEVHLCIDTGMGRYGFLPEETDKVLSLFNYMKSLAICGTYTHFHSAFCSEKATRRQYELFTAVLKKIRDAGFDPGMTHCCNSSALFRYPEMRLDAVRVGSAFLGRLAFRTKPELHRIGFAECTVEELRWLPKGHTTGYAAGWKAKEPTRIAVIGVGWYNGFAAERQNDLFRARDSLRAMAHYFRQLFFRRSIIVTVNGHKCRVLGHVGMVHAVVDVTGVDCSLGDRVVAQINPLCVKGLRIHYR